MYQMLHRVANEIMSCSLSHNMLAPSLGDPNQRHSATHNGTYGRWQRKAQPEPDRGRGEA